MVEEETGLPAGQGSSIQSDAPVDSAHSVPGRGRDIRPGRQSLQLCDQHLHPTVPLPLLGGSPFWPGGCV